MREIIYYLSDAFFDADLPWFPLELKCIERDRYQQRNIVESETRNSTIKNTPRCACCAFFFCGRGRTACFKFSFILNISSRLAIISEIRLTCCLFIYRQLDFPSEPGVASEIFGQNLRLMAELPIKEACSLLSVVINSYAKCHTIRFFFH